MRSASIGFAPALVLLAGCATTTPRFEPAVAATFAHEPMRVLVTPELELYYPEPLRPQALRIAARAAECLRDLRARQQTQRPRGRALLFITSANLNNAYVDGQWAGEPLHSLVPTQLSNETFALYGLNDADPGDVACHEMFHFAHYEQVENFWRGVNLVFGDVVAIQGALGSWFTEGVAQYYEGHLDRPVGRPHSAWYRGVFDSFVASRAGDVEAGDLSPYNRELYPESGAYLSGLFFVEWLIQRDGEEKLWAVMDLQARSFFSPLGVALRFKQIYGLSLGALVDAWAESLKKAEVRARPPAQRVLLPALGQSARLASHPASGALALVTSGNDEVPLLRLLAPDGAVRAERRLLRMWPWRQWATAGPTGISGLSFTADGRWLFFVNHDLAARGDDTAQLWKLDAGSGDVVEVWQGLGTARGGCVSPDGERYVLVRTGGTGTRLVERDLRTGEERLLVELPGETPASAPQWSPDGRRLVFSRLDAAGWNLVALEDGALRTLTHDGAMNYAPRFDRDGRVVFGRAHGPYVQAHRLDLDTGALERLSDTPYGAMDPAPIPHGVALVARDGTGWSLDAVPGAALETIPAQPAAPAEPAPRHEPPPLQIDSDEPYSGFDHLFLPQLRLPSATLGFATTSSGDLVPVATFYASLQGRDRLGWHNWAINAGLTVPTLDPDLWLAYRNLQLAPWSISLSGERLALAGDTLWNAALTVGRPIFTVPLAFGFHALVHEPAGLRAHKFIGPSFDISYAAFESTAYGGPQRLLGLSFSGSAYPRALGSDFDLLDGRIEVDAAIPLPASTRHNLTVSLVGRALYGAPGGTLRVGGVQLPGTLWWTPANAASLPDSGLILPGTLVEGLRGFEDRAVAANRAALGTARYEHAFIIDRGFASVLYLLPPLFFREVDVEVFGSAALTDSPEGPWMRAAGAAVILRTVFAEVIGLSLYYQFAYRFDLNLPALHTAGIALQ